MTRIIFIIAALGHGTKWAMLNSPELFKIPKGQGLFLTFGTPNQLDLYGKTNPFPRINETIKQNLLTTPPYHSLVYCGWELIDCLPDLWCNYPNARYFITTDTFSATMWEEYLKGSHKNPFIKPEDWSETAQDKLNVQFDKIKEFLKEKKYTLMCDEKNEIAMAGMKGIYI